MDEYSPQAKEILSRPGRTVDERKLELFFAPSATSQAAGRAWLDRVNARQVDREPATSPKVVPAQLAALEAWGAVPAADRYAQLKKITHRTLVVNGSERHHGPHREFVHSSAEASRRPAHSLS